MFKKKSWQQTKFQNFFKQNVNSYMYLCDGLQETAILIPADSRRFVWNIFYLSSEDLEKALPPQYLLPDRTSIMWKMSNCKREIIGTAPTFRSSNRQKTHWPCSHVPLSCYDWQCHGSRWVNSASNVLCSSAEESFLLVNFCVFLVWRDQTRTPTGCGPAVSPAVFLMHVCPDNWDFAQHQNIKQSTFFLISHPKRGIVACCIP